jgi:hypothetical protein
MNPTIRKKAFLASSTSISAARRLGLRVALSVAVVGAEAGPEAG